MDKTRRLLKGRFFKNSYQLCEIGIEIRTGHSMWSQPALGLVFNNYSAKTEAETTNEAALVWFVFTMTFEYRTSTLLCM